MHKYLPLFALLFFCLFSCKKNNTKPSAINSDDQQATRAKQRAGIYPVSVSVNAKHKAAYFGKLENGLDVKIACEGTSLTYGQNYPGVLPPINNSNYWRALYQYPETLHSALTTAGIHSMVINRGFPGDRTTEGLARWKDSTSADVVIVEYGTNDAYNFANYPSGPLAIPAYTDSLTKIVQRRLDQGAWVILCQSPQLYPANSTIDAYRSAISSVASSLDIPVFDVQSNVIAGAADYFDGIHLTGLAYQKWGLTIAPMLEKQ